MLQSLDQYIEQRLATEGTANIKPARFTELAGRLLAGGVVWREHSRPEAALYDDAIECEQLLREWFACIGVVLIHDSDARLLRLYPPGEGGGDEEEEDGVRRLRARLSRDLEAFEDGRRAVLQGTPQFFIVRRVLSLGYLVRRVGEVLAESPLPLKELCVQLQHRLQANADKAAEVVVQRFPDKGGYLQHLYGALMGKTAVGEHDATRAAKSIVKAMAYKELGNVNDLVRDEILEPHDFSKDLDKMRELMRSIASLKLEAERLALNLERLDAAQASADQVLDEARRFVTTTIAYALRAQRGTG